MMLLKELFSEWQDPSKLIAGGTIASTTSISRKVSWPFAFVLLGCYQLLCMGLAYRIINKK